jgi:hypothetical protein
VRSYARCGTAASEGGQGDGGIAYLAHRAVAEHWKAIDRFARALLAAGELRGRELKAVITAACSSG